MFPDIPNGRVYATSFQTPARFSIPWLALKTLRDFSYESVDELGPRGEVDAARRRRQTAFRVPPDRLEPRDDREALRRRASTLGASIR